MLGTSANQERIFSRLDIRARAYRLETTCRKRGYRRDALLGRWSDDSGSDDIGVDVGLRVSSVHSPGTIRSWSHPAAHVFTKMQACRIASSRGQSIDHLTILFPN